MNSSQPYLFYTSLFIHIHLPFLPPFLFLQVQQNGEFGNFNYSVNENDVLSPNSPQRKGKKKTNGSRGSSHTQHQQLSLPLQWQTKGHSHKDHMKEKQSPDHGGEQSPDLLASSDDEEENNDEELSPDLLASDIKQQPSSTVAISTTIGSTAKRLQFEEEGANKGRESVASRVELVRGANESDQRGAVSEKGSESVEDGKTMHSTCLRYELHNLVSKSARVLPPIPF